jgi:hypothetical protein
MRPEWIYSQGFYYEPRAGGKVRIFGFYNKRQTKKQTKAKLKKKKTKRCFVPNPMFCKKSPVRAG